MQLTSGASKTQLVVLPFGQRHIAHDQTDVQLPVAMAEANQAVDGYVAPFAGRVVAVAATLSGQASVGTLDIGATIDGTEDADTRLRMTTGVNGVHITDRKNTKFAAGARIGCEITTSHDWDGTSIDLAAQVYVLFDMLGV